MVQSPLLSVVSVTFDDPDGIERTLGSLSRLVSLGLVEVIVVDGSENPQTSSLVAKLDWPILISEPDAGIYDAMNKGARCAQGRFVWFLNGGDEAVVGPSVTDLLIRCLAGEQGYDDVHLFGYGIRGRSGIVWRRPRPARYLRHALPTSHQAILFPIPAFRSVGGYDVSYRMSGDYYLAAALYSLGYTFVTHEERIAIFEVGGVSSTNAARIAADASRIQREVLRVGPLGRWSSALRHRLARIYRRLRYM